MRIEVIENQVFDYNDLILPENKAILEAVIEDFQNDCSWAENSIDMEVDCISEELKEKGYIDPQIRYDLSYSQGSGASFLSPNLDLEKILEDYPIKHKKWLLDIIKEYIAGLYIKSNNSNYVHEKSTYIDFDIEFYYKSDLKIRRIIKAIININRILSSEILELNKDINRRLVKAQELAFTEEYILDSIQANEWEFYSNGKMV